MFPSSGTYIPGEHLTSLKEFSEECGEGLKELRTIHVHCSRGTLGFDKQFHETAQFDQEHAILRLLIFAISSNSLKMIKFCGLDNRQLEERLNCLGISVKA